MKRLTPKKKILSFIRLYKARTGESPTVNEIGDALGFKSMNGVVCHLKGIEAKGRLKRLRFMPRGLEVVDNQGIRFGGVVR